MEPVAEERHMDEQMNQRIKQLKGSTEAFIRSKKNIYILDPNLHINLFSVLSTEHRGK